MIEVAREDAEPMVGRGRRPLAFAGPADGLDVGLHRGRRNLSQANTVLVAPPMEVRQAARVGEDRIGREVTKTQRDEEPLRLRFDTTGLVGDNEGRQAGALEDPEPRHRRRLPSSGRSQTRKIKVLIQVC
jgi:hypothetical protein